MSRAPAAPLPYLALVGPTASGKSAAALALAQVRPVEIVSVDSALVYRGMDIGTAKPTAAEQARWKAEIDFQTGRLEARTLVPTVAVVTEDGRPGVLLVGRDNQPTFQPVELGVSGGKDTQILSGLRAGTRVFIDLPPWSKRKRS